MWEAGSKQVKETFQSYGKVDWLREYFDVEPAEVSDGIYFCLFEHFR